MAKPGVGAPFFPLALRFTFIASRLRDNAILTEKDPTYKARLMSLTRVDRERLLGDEERGGNWHSVDSAGTYFPRDKFRITFSQPGQVVRTVRAWDSRSRQRMPGQEWSIPVSWCRTFRRRTLICTT
jgi:hypothetical protein